MERTVFVTGSDRGLGYALSCGLLKQGWQVFAGQYMPDWPDLASLRESYPQALHLVPLDVSSLQSVQSAAQAVASLTDRLDVLINNAGVLSASTRRPIHEPQDYPGMQWMYDVNALGPLRMTEVFLPLLARSSMKRLCYVSSEAGSISRAQRTAWFGYCMSKAALNMAVKLLFNALHPDGYTFRVYHPGWVRSYIEGDWNPLADLDPQEAAARALPIFLGAAQDEDRLALIDHEGNQWPW